ncbi:nucleotide-diphospho-sugar transferase [Halteromyces radiatus]|uniref:nucleotide-diphospho-sugar transferase n=1 Tax=Halteromyces radiatus TaxID=101107 RepID=UPI0022207C19|nr:nucleotide-diphospho-sugar transferase [Halteromyces radiatus]KAI8086594.1 nucleotide-diphospho-sugar transferase [Halteromyces radiatus]
MPPKSKRPPQQQQHGDDEVEEPFQAVILTDSYDDRFLPISHELPKCLMHLCNIPLIEYTLEVLAITDVRDVFIVCTSHIDKIKAYLEQTNWMNPKGKLNIKIVQTPDAMSVGDALRELDARQLITNDFILTTGDLVSNIKLDKAIEAHRARKKTDKNAIMTMVLKEAARSHASRPQEASSVFVLDPQSSKCLFYEPVAALPKKSRIEISPEVLENHHQIEFRNDLVDPRVDICSVEVPALFTENFDWQRLRRDFVHGILTSDILGKTIYTHLVSEAYIAHIQNERIYNTVSMHVLNRWVFPIVPETNLKSGDDYEFMSGNIYKSRDVILSRSCIVDENVQIGAGTVIGENSRVAQSTIGRNCRIGANVTLVGVYLWDGVVIGDNCTVINSILANNVSILENTTIGKGCLLSSNVVIGPNDNIPKYSRLSLLPQPKTSMFDSEDEDQDEKDDGERVLTGDHEPVYFWSEIANDDDDIDIRNLKLDTLAYDINDLVLEDHELSESASEVGELSDEESDADSIDGAWNLNPSANAAKKSAEFKKEIALTIERSLAENHTVDTAALEITGLRMSSNGEYSDVREVVVPLVVDHVDLNNPVTSLKKVFTQWGPLIGKVTHKHDDQVHVISLLQKHCASNEALGKLFMGALQILYNIDVIEEEAVMEWYTSDISKSGSPTEIKLREKATKFVEWLTEAEEESEEESDDE